MNRLILASLASLVFLSPAAATVAPRPQRLPVEEVDFAPPCFRQEAAPAEETKQGFVITDDTDIRLDGEPCKYEDVPPGAEIIRLDVAADRHTIKAIHFRSKK